MNFFNFDFKNTTKEQIENLKNNLIYESNNVHDSVANFKGDVSFRTIINPLISVLDYCNVYNECIGFVSIFSTSEELRNYATECQTELSSHFIKLSMRKDIYDKFNDYYQGFYNTEKNFLNKEQIKYVEDSMIEFKQDGLNLPEEKRNKIQNLLEQISKNSNTYNLNINNDKTKLYFRKKELVGLPNDWFVNEKILKNVKELGYQELEGEDNQLYEVTLKSHDYSTILDNCINGNVRKQVYEKYAAKCYHQNTKIFEDIVKDRILLANKLGFNNFNDYKVQKNILNTGQKVMDFENNLFNIFKPKFDKDMLNLLQFANDNGLNKNKFDPWDLNYYDTLYKKCVHNIDQIEISKYFSMENVLKNMFDIFQHILSLKIIKVDNENIWHDSVEFFQLVDADTLETLGYFYLDLYEREGKYPHFACCNLTSRFNSLNNQYFQVDVVLPIGCIVGNFSNNQSLNHEDVVSMFHEFGHLMHFLCCKAEYSDHCSFGTAIDFVETPSQLFEYWCFSPVILKIISKHKDTGDHLTDKLIDNIIQHEKINKSLYYMRQIFYGLVDIKIHSHDINTLDTIDSEQIYNESYQSIMSQTRPENTNGFSYFTHLIGGYESGYYSYLRSKAYSANLYYAKFKNNELDRDIGIQYKNKILQNGSIESELTIMENFLQEKLNDNYFLNEIEDTDQHICQNDNKKRRIYDDDKHIQEVS